MTTVYLVRHGATEWNLSGRAQGQADIELNAVGREQVGRLADELSDVEVAAVYSSDLKRAVDTAAPIAAALGLGVELDPAFREIDQGEWEGHTPEEIRRRWPELWGPARHYRARPGGESPEEVRDRALEGLARIARKHPSGNVIVVSHGGTIRWLSAAALGYDLVRSATIRGVGNAGVVSVDACVEDGRLILSDLRRRDGKTTGYGDPNA
jgi:broad specificity phosphatase PhoE